MFSPAGIFLRNIVERLLIRIELRIDPIRHHQSITNGVRISGVGDVYCAIRDPDGANLDRVQVVKGWLDGDGELHERVYDIAVSDDRTIGSDGRARESVGSTVDIAKGQSILQYRYGRFRL